MEIATDIRGPLKIHCDCSADPETYPLVSPAASL